MCSKIGRRQCIPIIYTKGTHYEVGFDVGRTVGTIIRDFIQQSKFLKEELLPAYESVKGRKAYEDTLECVKTNFPQYVSELEGTADGAQVPFHILFLFHLDRILTTANGQSNHPSTTGCSTLCVNQPSDEVLGHTEDALTDYLGHFYFVSAHIVSETPQGRYGVTEEKFTSLCYAGHIPGYTMNYNHHGLVYSINTLDATEVFPGKTPRVFITRALLATENFQQARQVLEDVGCGAGDGCSINMTFLKENNPKLFYNIEMGPSGEENLSRLDILEIHPGENSAHYNSYLRLSISELSAEMKDSSVCRMNVLSKYETPKCAQDVIQMLGDTSTKDYQVFQESGPDEVSTIAAGIFDCHRRTWSIYADNPRNHEPLVVLPLIINED